MNREPRRGLHPEHEPHQTGHLQVSELHRVYYEVSGNPQGKPVLFVHGGPGGATDPKHRRFFDPARYRIVLVDQRGCGKSTPHAELRENTTWHLTEDFERVRAHLGIERWQVFGGSWGSTLGLAYAEKHPERVTELVLRGIFLMRRWELEWLYQGGTSQMFPDAWEDFLAAIPVVEHGDLIGAYHRRLTSEDPAERQRAAVAWSVWEARTSTLYPSEEQVARMGADEFSLAFARIEAHYFVHMGFLERVEQLLEDAVRLRDIPTVIVQGRYDVVCPPRSAWELSKAMPHARLVIVPDAGHSAFEPGNVDALVRATDEFAGRG